MASGGMDTLPHNGAVITLLAITGLSHRRACGGFAITVIKASRYCLSLPRSVLTLSDAD